MSAGRKSLTHRHAELRRENRSLARLPGTGDAAAEKWLRVALVIDRLAVAADQLTLQASAPLRRAHRIGIKFSQQEVESREIGNTGRRRVHGGEYRASDVGRIGKLVVRQQFQPGAKAAP